MNWSRTQIVAFENDFRKRRFIESFFINSTANVINEKSSDLFPQTRKATLNCKQRWTINKYAKQRWLNIILHTLLCFRSVYSLFYGSFYSSLSHLQLQRRYHCYHYVMQSRAFGEFYYSPVLVTIHYDAVSWLKRRCRFKKNFSTVEQRLIIVILLAVSVTCSHSFNRTAINDTTKFIRYLERFASATDSRNWSALYFTSSTKRDIRSLLGLALCGFPKTCFFKPSEYSATCLLEYSELPVKSMYVFPVRNDTASCSAWTFWPCHKHVVDKSHRSEE